MISDLSNFVIFLHGLSGSGKGVINSLLLDEYQKRGYKVFYGSSGELFRAALHNPRIAEQVNQGIFLYTLGAVIPGLNDLFREFIASWVLTEYRQVLILDGFIRRTEFTTNEGDLIKSQLEQICIGFDEVLSELSRTDEPGVLALFPEYRNKGNTIHHLVSAMKQATHLLTSINPEDAETQMRLRSVKELESIQSQLEQQFVNGKITSAHKKVITNHLEKFYAILSGGISYRNGEEIWLPRNEWGFRLHPNEYPKVVQLVKELKSSLATELGLDPDLSFAQLFKALGISTELREDDIPDLGRKKRIENYIANYITRLLTPDLDSNLYQPGFATIALTKEFNFVFHRNGDFSSTNKNCVVIHNGKSKGIDLQKFKESVYPIVKDIVEKTEAYRINLV